MTKSSISEQSFAIFMVANVLHDSYFVVVQYSILLLGPMSPLLWEGTRHVCPGRGTLHCFCPGASRTLVMPLRLLSTQHDNNSSFNNSLGCSGLVIIVSDSGVRGPRFE